MITGHLVDNLKLSKRFNGIVVCAGGYRASIYSKSYEFDRLFHDDTKRRGYDQFSLDLIFEHINRHSRQSYKQIKRMIKWGIPNALEVYNQPHEKKQKISLELYRNGKMYERLIFIANGITIASNPFTTFLFELINFIRYTMDGSKYIVYSYTTMRVDSEKARNFAEVSEFDLEADQTEYWYTITSPFDVELATFIKAAGEKSIIYQTKWNGNSSGICRAFFGSFKSADNEIFKSIPHKRYDLIIYNNNELMVYDPYDVTLNYKTYELSLISVDEAIKFKTAELTQRYSY